MFFDKETHTFFDDNGGPLQGVTSTLAEAGKIDSRFYTNSARDRGSRVHQLISMIDHGTPFMEVALLLREHEYEYIGYLSAYMEFLGSVNPHYDYQEVAVCHPRLGYAGIADRLGRDQFGENTIWDFKTGGKAVWHMTQLVMYREAAAQYVGEIVGSGNIVPAEPFVATACCAVYLKKSGRFALDAVELGQYEYKEEYKEALDALKAAEVRDGKGAV